MTDVEEKVKKIIAEGLSKKPEEINSKASLIDDLGADDSDTIELVMALEEEFDIQIPDEDAEKLKIVNDIIDYITKHSKVTALGLTVGQDEIG